MTNLEGSPTPNPPKPLTTAQYRTERRKKKHPFNFELDANRRAQLRAIAESRGISMGATLRQLISTAHTMTVDRQPHCVDGRSCFMPHLHAQSTAPIPHQGIKP